MSDKNDVPRRGKNSWFILVRDTVYVVTVVPIILLILLSIWIGIKVARPPRMKARESFTDAGLGGKHLSLHPSDDVTLDAWLVEQETTNIIVVVTHELGACKESKFRLARMLQSLGVSALFFDLRNHGKSSFDATYSNQGERYTDDIQCALKSAKKLGYEKVVLFAASFSTFPALYVLKRDDIQSSVDAVIMDSGPTVDLKHLMKRYLDAYAERLLPSFCRGGLSQVVIGFVQPSVTEWCFNVDWPSKDIESIPKLFITGDEDTIATIDQVNEVREHYANSRLWVVPGAAHLQTMVTSSKEYQRQLQIFVESI